jgi:hypothetical protein
MQISKLTWVQKLVIVKLRESIKFYPQDERTSHRYTNHTNSRNKLRKMSQTYPKQNRWSKWSWLASSAHKCSHLSMESGWVKTFCFHLLLIRSTFIRLFDANFLWWGMGTDLSFEVQTRERERRRYRRRERGEHKRDSLILNQFDVWFLFALSTHLFCFQHNWSKEK